MTIQDTGNFSGENLSHLHLLRLTAPGGPEADPTAGCTLGDRMYNYGNDDSEISAVALDGKGAGEDS